jgi:hypothetical protein
MTEHGYRERVDHTSTTESVRRYSKPVLTNWGSVLDLTRGPEVNVTDFPLVGGSNPV